MNLYRNGAYVETFRQNRDIDILNKYLAAHAEPRNPPAPETTPEATSTTVSAPEPTPETDPLVEEVVALREDVNPSGAVVSLDETNFRQTIDKGHVFVKFFAPWYVLPLSLLRIQYSYLYTAGADIARSLRRTGRNSPASCATN